MFACAMSSGRSLLDPQFSAVCMTPAFVTPEGSFCSGVSWEVVCDPTGGYGEEAILQSVLLVSNT
jgi:hypothetical protein